MQNDTPMTTKASKPKPETEFKYGGHLLSETGSSNNSAVEWDTFSMFGVKIVLDLSKSPRLSNPKPEANLRRCGRHLENTYDVITQLKMV